MNLPYTFMMTPLIDLIVDYDTSKPGYPAPKKVRGYKHILREGLKVGRNESCKCGSGKKNKRCCNTK